MKIETLLNELNSSKDSDIHFELEENQVIPVGYHLTEIINEDRKSMDCGGNIHAEQRVLIQLHSRSTDVPEKQLSAGKFADIIEIANQKLNLFKEVDVHIEYGSAQMKTATYAVQEISKDEKGLKVHLFENAAACKPALVSACGEGSSCC
jgi:hypothetical protein